MHSLLRYLNQVHLSNTKSPFQYNTYSEHKFTFIDRMKLNIIFCHLISTKNTFEPKLKFVISSITPCRACQLKSKTLHVSKTQLKRKAQIDCSKGIDGRFDGLFCLLCSNDLLTNTGN